jgi:glycerol uptake facilitator-like aquaporin
MESAKGWDNKFTVCLYEAIGTFIIMVGLNFGGEQSNITVPAMMFIAIMCLGKVSGGHFNPAVTVGILFTMQDPMEKNHLKFSLSIMFAQLLGAGVGAFFSRIAVVSDRLIPIGPMCPWG